MRIQQRVNLVEKAIHQINMSAHMDRWLVDQDAHWHQGPLDPAYVEATRLLVDRREELKKIKDSKSEA